MTKSYTDELAEWVEKGKSTGRDKNLVAFHGVRDDVHAAIEAGYSAKTIWTNMRESGRVSFGYESFVNYVNRFIKKPKDAKAGVQSGGRIVAAAAEQVLPATAPTPAAPSSGTRAKRTGMPAFTFNPIPAGKEGKE